MTATYAGHPIPRLWHLPEAARLRLLARLDRDCQRAKARHAAILRARWLAQPPTTRHDTRRTA